MAGADAVGHWDLSFVASRVLELHAAGTGVHAGCGGCVAAGVGGDDEGVAGLNVCVLRGSQGLAPQHGGDL